MGNNTQAKRKPVVKKCRRGHRMTADNTYVRPDGYGACRECMLDADKRHREKSKEQGGDE